MRRLLPLAAALALACAASPAPAQGIDTTAVETTQMRLLHIRDGTVQVEIVPGLSRVGEEAEGPPASRFPIEALPPADRGRLRSAEVLRRNGQLDQARTALAPLLRSRPHHPAVVTEQARQLAARQDWRALERLGRAERAARRDSLLVSHELALALERLRRPRDAAAVALESWVASPAEADWARATVLRLAPADPRGVREAARRAAGPQAGRPDLALTAALLDWRAGDLRAALEGLARAERPGPRTAPLRWELAQELAATGVARDSGAAIEALVDVAGDARLAETWRVASAQRAWDLALSRGDPGEVAAGLAGALRGVPAERWPGDLLVAVTRGLRESGRTDEARTLAQTAPARRGVAPQLALEQALADLRDGPPERALPRLATLAGSSPEADWRYAEALFFAGRTDSALAVYQRVAASPGGAWSGAALERVYLIEDADPAPALPAFGRIAYARWRGDEAGALALTDSLAAALPRGPLWAQAQLMRAESRAQRGDLRGALPALLALADSLPADRLAPLARQKAGDLLLRLDDQRGALAQYEECLVRYPRAWNAAEVRRAAEKLRRGEKEKRLP